MLRNKKFQDLEKVDAAARTLYLNRTCFNGLYRVNKKGDFNVPFGKYKNPNIVQEDRIKDASKILKSSKIHCHDFKKLNKHTFNKSDLVFFDPPYVPVSKFSDFTIINDEFNKALSSLKSLILLNKIEKHKEIVKLNMQF